MSIRQLRARLERAAQRLQQEFKKNPATIFPVDPEFALALREPLAELHLTSFRIALHIRGDPNEMKELKERLRILDQEVAERIAALRIPANYTYEELCIDEKRLRVLERLPRERGGVPLTEAELLELAQIEVRLFAFSRSPEGLDRARIAHLYCWPELSAEEQAEFDRLQARYHAEPSAMYQSVRAFRRGSPQNERANPPRIRRP